MKRRITGLIAVAVAVAFAPAVQAGNDANSSYDAANNSPQSNSSTSKSRQQRMLSGEVDSFKKVPLTSRQGRREQHTLVRIRLENGRKTVVDLGPNTELGDLDLERGDHINIQGQPDTIDDRPVLMADQIWINDQAVKTAWSRQMGSPSSSDQGEGQFTVRGTIDGYSVMNIRSPEHQTTLLTLRLQDGRSILVDLGHRYGPSDLLNVDLRDQVVIRGERQQVNGETVLLADEIVFNEPSAGSEDTRRQVRGEQ